MTPGDEAEDPFQSNSKKYGVKNPRLETEASLVGGDNANQTVSRALQQ